MIVGAVVLVFETCCDWSPFFADDTQQMYKNTAFGGKKQAIEAGREALKLASTGDIPDDAETEVDDAETEVDDADGDKAAIFEVSPEPQFEATSRHRS